MKQNQLSRPKDTMIKKIGKALMVPLTAGLLMLGPKVDAQDKKSKEKPIAGTLIISGKISKCKGLIGEAILVSPKNKCKFSVKKNDYIYKLEFLTEVAGHFGLKVLDVDKKGVTFDMQMEIYMSEHMTGKFRVNFDGTVSPEIKKRNPNIGKVLKVEKTKDPNVAKVTLSKGFSTSDFFETKKTPQ